MKIKILGTRAEIEASAPYHSRHSGILIDNEILIDLGEKEFLKYDPRHIFLTHLHPDHAYFVESGENPEQKIYAPETKNFDNIEVIDEEKDFGYFKIAPVPTHHSKRVDSQAYIVEKDDSRILYTGDLIWINKEHHDKIGNVDLVITEASFLRKQGMIKRDEETGQIYGHAGIPRLIGLFSQFSSDIAFMHFGSWFYKDMKKGRRKFKELAKNNGLNLIVTYDGMEIDTEKL